MAAYNSESTKEAVSRLLVSQPFFSVLISRLGKIVEDPQLPAAGATDGRNIYINPAIIEPWTPNERVTLICHEVMHIVLRHLIRVRGYPVSGPDGKPINMKKANIAMDYVINYMLVEAGMAPLGDRWVYSPEYGNNESWEEVYCRLDDKEEEQDDHSKWGDTVEISEEELRRATKQAASAAKQVGKELRGSLKQLVVDITEPQIAWETQLDLAVEQTLGKDDITWSKPNRRWMSRGMYFPGSYKEAYGTVVVYEDSSGSITTKERSTFRSEIVGVMERANPSALYMGSCDTEPTPPLLIEDMEDIISFETREGGGTDMPAIFPAIEHLEPDCLIILTDGYTPWGKAPPFPVIWVINSNVQAPYGKTLKIST
jgi:predicted metal-dependent peptidase